MNGLPTKIKGTDGRVYTVGKIVTGQILSFDGKGMLFGVAAGTPGLHAASHQFGGLDQINVAGLSGLLATPQTPATHTHAEADVTGLVADLAARELSANKGTANGYASLDAAGIVPLTQLPNKFAPGSFTVATGRFHIMSGRLQLTTTQRATLAGTARLRIT
jgi:hypothetical protein